MTSSKYEIQDIQKRIKLDDAMNHRFQWMDGKGETNDFIFKIYFDFNVRNPHDDVIFSIWTKRSITWSSILYWINRSI